MPFLYLSLMSLLAKQDKLMHDQCKTAEVDGILLVSEIFEYQKVESKNILKRYIQIA